MHSLRGAKELFWQLPGSCLPPQAQHFLGQLFLSSFPPARRDLLFEIWTLFCWPLLSHWRWCSKYVLASLPCGFPSFGDVLQLCPCWTRTCSSKEMRLSSTRYRLQERGWRQRDGNREGGTGSPSLWQTSEWKERKALPACQDLCDGKREVLGSELWNCLIHHQLTSECVAEHNKWLISFLKAPDVGGIVPLLNGWGASCVSCRIAGCIFPWRLTTKCIYVLHQFLVRWYWTQLYLSYFSWHLCYLKSSCSWEH